MYVCMKKMESQEEGWENQCFEEETTANEELLQFPLSAEELGLKLPSNIKRLTDYTNCWMHQMLREVESLGKEPNKELRKAKLRILSMYYYSIFFGKEEDMEDVVRKLKKERKKIDAVLYKMEQLQVQE